MGDNFHFGYFEDPETDLGGATDALIDKMLELCPATPESRVLDVGCGIGNPAFYIHARHGCRVLGISTSARGIELANRESRRRGLDGAVQFRVADGCDNGLPNGAFDVAWVMESSHLMHDKKKLFRECFWVLKSGGTLLLCDIMLMRILPFHRELALYSANAVKYLRLMRAFGNARVNSPGTYCNGLIEAGFREVTTVDITEKTIPTLRHWRENAFGRPGCDTGQLYGKEIGRFIRGTEILEEFFLAGIFGYSLLRAVK